MSDSLPEVEAGSEAAVPAAGESVPQPEPPVAEPEDDPAGPAPLNVPRTPTGHSEVDTALERLADADHLATDGHGEVYEDVHRGLRDALTALDARPGPPVPPRTYENRS
ncbi:hypothetical protein P1P68_13585 [Streptomyces scabiei]|uniref:hypothetical protein n=1 Tax=Streptomyces scabiei TaxID=1930 RepID=UPI00298FC90D|nr:hypothetical protein [Streptomyces scabiei]MDW8805791.1 hypothetical protein [Streptomyces scabiei]